jgi:hypothetical protein
MTDNVENLILEQLRLIRAELAGLKRDNERDHQDIKMRLSGLEGHQVAAHHDSVRQSVRLDDLDERLQRVERRLEIRDTP